MYSEGLVLPCEDGLVCAEGLGLAMWLGLRIKAGIMANRYINRG